MFLEDHLGFYLTSIFTEIYSKIDQIDVSLYKFIT
jgi:hypothetical protein